MTDRELQRIHWSNAGLDAYAEAAEQCKCEALCSCGWDDPDAPAMRWIERLESRQRAVTTDR